MADVVADTRAEVTTSAREAAAAAPETQVQEPASTGTDESSVGSSGPPQLDATAMPTVTVAGFSPPGPHVQPQPGAHKLGPPVQMMHSPHYPTLLQTSRQPAMWQAPKVVKAPMAPGIVPVGAHGAPGAGVPGPVAQGPGVPVPQTQGPRVPGPIAQGPRVPGPIAQGAGPIAQGPGAQGPIAQGPAAPLKEYTGQHEPGQYKPPEGFASLIVHPAQPAYIDSQGHAHPVPFPTAIAPALATPSEAAKKAIEASKKDKKKGCC